MIFEGIIITGTSCAGKSTISQELCNGFINGETRFEIVKAVTTRNECADDTEEESEYNKVIQNKSVPVLEIKPTSIIEVLTEKNYMCIFLDAQDEILIDRQEKRLRRQFGKTDKRKLVRQNKEDRSYQNKAHYILNNSDISSSVSLIISLWNYQNQGGALSQKLIKNMLDCGVLLREADSKMIKGASYDLRLGDEYYYDGEIRKLSDANPFLTIEPYDYVIVSCQETAWMPRDIIAKFGLTVGLFCQGIILSNGPQIDPGFRGKLFCLLFNTSNRAVHLKRGKHYATIEFNKLIGYAEPYEGQYQDKKSIIDYIPENALHGAINELKKEVEKLKAESRIMQNIYLGVVALMFAIISILLVLN